MNEQLKIVITAVTDGVKSAVKGAKDEIDKLDKKAGTSASSIKEKFSKIGSGVKSALGVATKAIAGAITGITGLVAATEQYAVNQAKLTSAFESAGGSAATATETYNNLYRVLGDGDVATEAANHLAKLTTNQEDLAEWTNICQGVYATFGDSLPIEGLTEAANETAKTGVVTGNLADALNWAGISEDAFNEKLAACNTEAEREKLIRETLNGVYDEASKKYEEMAADVIAQNEAQANLQANLALVGSALRPVVTLFTELAASALALVLPYIQTFVETYLPMLQSGLESLKGILDGAKNGVSGIGDAIANLGVKIQENIPIVVEKITTMMSNLGTAIKENLPLIVDKGLDMLVGLAGNIKKNLPKIVSSGMDLLKSLVKGLMDSLPSLIEKAPKIINDLASAINKAFPIILAKGVGIILEIIKGLIKAIPTLVANIPQIIKAIVNVITAFSWVNLGKKIVTGLISGVKGLIGSFKGTAKSMMDKVANTIKSVINKIKGFMKFKWSLPKLKMPRISIRGKFSLNPPSAPKFSINWNRLGGIFDKPTIFGYGGSLQGLGEDGAEAVVPLEKNTQWLDRLAERLSAKQNGIPIVLQVDGKTFAQVSIDSINALTKQRGTLGLNLV